MSRDIAEICHGTLERIYFQKYFDKDHIKLPTLRICGEVNVMINEFQNDR